ncbi:hypothetical protein SSX86_019615 [Deinandra increscens subsp. villosa]|uniref:BED-type domain-containing protein n=1 Tax=Deinandra increscens subsp. villosa TaxID=3103831 RepID=A0AAP0GVS3_9ASTR
MLETGLKAWFSLFWITPHAKIKTVATSSPPITPPAVLRSPTSSPPVISHHPSASSRSFILLFSDSSAVRFVSQVTTKSDFSFNQVIGLFSTIMGREPDPGWAHGTHVQGTKNSVLCKFCGFKSTGGITRHKHHLAWDSSEVSKCPKVPPDVKQFFKELFEKSNQAKEVENRIPHFDDVVDLEDDDEDEIPSFNEGQSKGKRPIPSSSACASNKKTKGPLDKIFKPSVTSGKKGGHLVGSVQHKEVQKKLRLEAVQLFCRWLYDAGLPFNSLKRLLDEDVGDVDGEENDVMAYKDFVVTSDGDNDDDDGEPGYDDLDDD